MIDKIITIDIMVITTIGGDMIDKIMIVITITIIIIVRHYVSHDESIQINPIKCTVHCIVTNILL